MILQSIYFAYKVGIISSYSNIIKTVWVCTVVLAPTRVYNFLRLLFRNHLVDQHCIMCFGLLMVSRGVDKLL